MLAISRHDILSAVAQVHCRCATGWSVYSGNEVRYWYVSHQGSQVEVVMCYKTTEEPDDRQSRTPSRFKTRTIIIQNRLFVVVDTHT